MDTHAHILTSQTKDILRNQAHAGLRPLCWNNCEKINLSSIGPNVPIKGFKSCSRTSIKGFKSYSYFSRTMMFHLTTTGDVRSTPKVLRCQVVVAMSHMVRLHARHQSYLQSMSYNNLTSFGVDLTFTLVSKPMKHHSTHSTDFGT